MKAFGFPEIDGVVVSGGFGVLFDGVYDSLNEVEDVEMSFIYFRVGRCGDVYHVE